MLEVVFGDSTKASMRIAKNYDEKSWMNGGVAYIGKKPSKAELSKHFEGKPLGGSSQDVVSIGFNLDIGDISGQVNGRQRRRLLYKMWERFNLPDREAEKFFQNQEKDMEKLLFAANNGMPIRIWRSNSPYSTCGFYFVCDLLRNTDCKISLVSLPETKKISKNVITTYNDWDEVRPGEFHQFIDLEKELSQVEKKVFSNHWRDLRKENSPLRAIVNGRLISVPENFYDHIIIKSIPDGDFLMGRLIGEIIGKYKIGISDSWYALRIDKMIEENKLLLVENKDPSHPYGKILRKTRI